jgi:hypothetical protein
MVKGVFGAEFCAMLAGLRQPTGYCGGVAAKAASDVDIVLMRP